MKADFDNITDSRLRDAAMTATTKLDEVVGKSASLVTAMWTQKKDAKQRSVLEIRVSDPFGSATALFAPEEFTQPEHLSERMLVLWGDLLQSKTDHLIRQLNAETVAAE